MAFDLGETLVDETRFWSEWAEWAGVRPFVLMAALGATIVQRRPHDHAFALAAPGFDPDAARAERRAAGWLDAFVEADLFPDARACVDELRGRGLTTCIAGNQPGWFAEAIRAWELPIDVVTTAEHLGAVKPEARFFTSLVELLGVRADEIAYVGDRVDNDVAPAAAAGMVAVHLRRGPWAFLQADWPEAGQAGVSIGSLAELPEALARV